MAKVKHLHEIKGRFAVRMGVPAALHGIVFDGDAGSALLEWLGTDRKVAERAASEVVARFRRRIDEAKTLLQEGPRFWDDDSLSWVNGRAT